MTEEQENYNLFMKCSQLNNEAFRPLPNRLTTRLCKRDELHIWKEMWAQGKYMDFVNDYYNKVYAPNEDEFFRRCTFIVDSNDKPVATCYIWRSYGRINTVGWYHVLPEYEGMGIGRVMLGVVLKNAELPVYVHTHPIATRAIKLYSDFGFEFLDNPVIGHRKNHLQESLPLLGEIMPPVAFSRLKITSADEEFLSYVLSSDLDEF